MDEDSTRFKPRNLGRGGYLGISTTAAITYHFAL